MYRHALLDSLPPHAGRVPKHISGPTLAKEAELGMWKAWLGLDSPDWSRLLLCSSVGWSSKQQTGRQEHNENLNP